MPLLIMVVAALWVFFVTAQLVCAADHTDLLEQRVKAAFLWKFTSYVEWPESSYAQSDLPFTIAVVGADLIAEELLAVTSERTLYQRPVVVRRLMPGESLAGVHILFIGDSEFESINQLAQSAQTLSVLTVTESVGALEHGSIINFTIVERRVRFEISLGAARKNNLRLSSRLLAVAHSVQPGIP